MSEWQPIETAPREESVLLCHKSGEVFSADWDEFGKMWCGPNGFFEDTEFTHWMPLPEPPEEAQ